MESLQSQLQKIGLSENLHKNDNIYILDICVK